MATPEIVNDEQKKTRLHDAIEDIMVRLDKHDIGFGENMARLIITRAAQFFAYCPEDFGLDVSTWLDGHLVFGGTNRLHWSIWHGFYPSREHCSERFLKQFAGEVWEPIGILDESGPTKPHFVVTGSAGGKVVVPTAWSNSHHTVLGRKDKNGQIAEIKILTGTEA